MSALNINIETKLLRSKTFVIPRSRLTATSDRFQRSLPSLPRSSAPPVLAFAAPPSLPYPIREEKHVDSDDVVLKPLPRKVEGIADDPGLHNPLERLERLGTGWLGVILELEGVCVDYEYGDITSRAWLQLAKEDGKVTPPIWALRKAEGMKNEQAIQEVFCWTRNPMEVRRLAARKEEILGSLLKDRRPLVPSGVPQLLDTLQRTGSPAALVSSAPEVRVSSILKESGLMPRFEVIVTGDDVYRGKPDPEGYLYAAQRIGRPPVRCVVVGSSNLSVEAAHEVGMQCVAVAGRHPVYELTAADLVVRSLSDLSFVNLKQLFALEEGVLPHSDELAAEEEPEDDEYDSGGPSVTTTVLDW